MIQPRSQSWKRNRSLGERQRFHDISVSTVMNYTNVPVVNQIHSHRFQNDSIIINAKGQRCGIFKIQSCNVVASIKNDGHVAYEKHFHCRQNHQDPPARAALKMQISRAIEVSQFESKCVQYDIVSESRIHIRSHFNDQMQYSGSI